LNKQSPTWKSQRNISYIAKHHKYHQQKRKHLYVAKNMGLSLEH